MWETRDDPTIRLSECTTPLETESCIYMNQTPLPQKGYFVRAKITHENGENHHKK